MKKVIFVLLALALLMLCIYAIAEETYVCEGFEYALQEDGNAILLQYSGADSTLIIPNELDGHPVTNIANMAFSYNSSLKRVTISYGIKIVGNYAFAGCLKLENIVLPESLTSIGAFSFSECMSLLGIIIPKSVVEIGQSAFSGCNSLNSVVLSEGTTSIGSWAFSNCPFLSKVTIPSTVSTIGNHVFESYTFSSPFPSVSSDIIFSVISDSYAESWCIKYNLQYELSSIEDDGQEDKAFRSSGFEYVLLPDGSAELIQFVGYYNTVEIPIELDGHLITKIRRNPFVSYTEVGDSILNPEAKYCIVKIPENHPCLKMINGVIISITDNSIVYCPTTMIGEYLIPDGISAIGDYAFFGCNCISSIVIPDSVTSIGEGAFGECIALEKIAIPSGITAIEKMTFFECNSIKDISIPDGVMSIGSYAFYKCSSLSNVTLPNTIERIGDSAFQHCSSITRIVIPEGVKSIAGGIFLGCISLSDLTISYGVEVIWNGAFNGCTALTRVIIPNSVKLIAYAAFQNCRNLTSVTIPESVTSIEDHAFDNKDGEISNATFYHIPDLVFTVTSNSYAEEWCINNEYDYIAEGNEQETYYIDQTGQFEYILLPTGDAEIVNYLGKEGYVMIPIDLDDHPVAAIDGNPFLIYNDDGYVCGSLDCNVVVSREHPYLATIEGVLFSMNDRKLIYCPPSMKACK